MDDEKTSGGKRIRDVGRRAAPGERRLKRRRKRGDTVWIKERRRIAGVRGSWRIGVRISLIDRARIDALDGLAFEDQPVAHELRTLNEGALVRSLGHVFLGAAALEL